MRRHLGRRFALLAALGTSVALVFGAPLGTSATGAPPPAGFTAAVRADAAETTSGQNEPQVTVDQSGTAYVTWQSGQNGSDTSKSRDGVHFTYLGYPDPATPNTGIGTGDIGDVTVSRSSFPDPLHDTAADTTGDNAVFWGNLAQGGVTCANSPIEIRAAATIDGGTWTRQATAGCEPLQIDRPWLAAYTPPAYRGTDQASSHTSLYYEYHDFGVSNIWVEGSTNGGETWAPTSVSAVQAGTPEALTSTCNTIPGGIAVDENGTHQGRIYAVWETSDLNENAVQGCNYTQAEAFDHIFLSYSDDGGATWTSRTVFNDPCAPNPPTPPANPSTCQDVSEIFSSIAVDQAGNVYVAYVRRDISQRHPEYDVYVATSSDGGNVFTSHKANTDAGTHYFPWVAAGGNGGVDVVFYDTPYVEGVGALNKPTSPATRSTSVTSARPASSAASPPTHSNGATTASCSTTSESRSVPTAARASPGRTRAAPGPGPADREEPSPVKPRTSSSPARRAGKASAASRSAAAVR
ncbi:MAG: exo-alpha-sialidase [Actinobacteria bacterium]|nr:MAG: exo-alpha-sialidase [Actinomycetota bacterium]